MRIGAYALDLRADPLGIYLVICTVPWPRWSLSTRP